MGCKWYHSHLKIFCHQLLTLSHFSREKATPFTGMDQQPPLPPSSSPHASSPCLRQPARTVSAAGWPWATSPGASPDKLVQHQAL